MNTTLPTPLISVDELFTEFRSGRAPAMFNASAGLPLTAFANGIHVYFQIGVTLPLSAAEDDESAERFVELLADFAAIGEGAAQIAEARLLEIQSGRLHFLLEDEPYSATPSISALHRLFSLAHAVINASNERLEPKAGKHWRGCCAAADFGQAALLHSSVGGGSIVSLGNPANRPAKRLDQEPAVNVGCLALPDTLLPKELGGGTASRWIEIDVRKPNEATREFLTSNYRSQLQNYMSTRAAWRPRQFRVFQPNPAFYESAGSGGAVNPTWIQGFCFRADLDGFSKQIASAFAQGQEAVIQLVNRFHQVLDFPHIYARSIRARALVLPWAGDCATILLLPPYGETITSERTSLPVTAALEWHKAFGADRKFEQSVGNARWALGIAAGDVEEGNDGHMLVADLPALGRTFRISAGWASRRSDDACQYPGVVGGDTVITKVDRRHLWSEHAEKFKDIGSNLARAPLESLKKAAEERARRAAQSVTTASSLPARIPAPRPYFP